MFGGDRGAAVWNPLIAGPGGQHHHDLGGHHLGRGAGYRLQSLFSMHVLTSVLKSIEPRIDDDFVDRLNYYYTSGVIIMMAILVSAKQYAGHPIECWVPAQFTKAMEQYTENYCWIQNTYWVPFDDFIPQHTDDREERQIGYYQWVPFVLAIEALMFYIPTSVWRLMNSQSGINVHAVLELACDPRNIEPQNRLCTVGVLSRHIDDALRHQREFGRKKRAVYLWAFVRIGKFYGAYVTLMYCFVKFLYFVNAFGQFFLLNRFLASDGTAFLGLNIILNLMQGIEWQNSGAFPRVTLCDFDIRVLGNIHRHTVQCVLVINMFTEKIFLFLWLWFLLLALLTFVNMVYWLLTVSLPSLRIRFVMRCLELSDAPPDFDKDSKHLSNFVRNYLRPDGIFLLRMVCNQSGTVLGNELAFSLWTRYREMHKTPRAAVLSDAVNKPTANEKPSNDGDQQQQQPPRSRSSTPLIGTAKAAVPAKIATVGKPVTPPQASKPFPPPPPPFLPSSGSFIRSRHTNGTKAGSDDEVTSGFV